MRKNAKQKEQHKTLQQKGEQKSEKVLSSLVGSLEDIEDALEGDASDVETVAEAPVTEYAQPMIKKRKTMFVVGLLVIAMAIVGVVSTVRAAVDTASDFFNQTALKNEFAEFVYPLVITDTPAFEKVADIPASVVVTASVWNLILNYDTSKYPTDTGIMTVSEIDIENSAASLFGQSVTVEHQTVGSIETMFEYNEAEKSYYIPAEPIVNAFTPRVSAVSNEGELYTVTVEYMSPSMFTFDEDHEETPSKTVIYTISRSAATMTVQSVKYVG